jgi:hypothetical protein
MESTQAHESVESFCGFVVTSIPLLSNLKGLAKAE